jgi:hypothetical protein
MGEPNRRFEKKFQKPLAAIRDMNTLTALRRWSGKEGETNGAGEKVKFLKNRLRGREN